MEEKKNKDAVPEEIVRLMSNARARYKSVGRAMRRGHVSFTGIMAPHRPFNNRRPTHGRGTNEEKKRLYERFKFNQPL